MTSKHVLIRSSCLFGSILPLWMGTIAPATALPPPEDSPEEVLRTEIILEARSPIDGRPLTVAEYAELEDQLQNPDWAPQLDPRVRDIIFLLQIRRGLLDVLPFLPL